MPGYVTDRLVGIESISCRRCRRMHRWLLSLEHADGWTSNRRYR